MTGNCIILLYAGTQIGSLRRSLWQPSASQERSGQQTIHRSARRRLSNAVS